MVSRRRRTSEASSATLDQLMGQSDDVADTRIDPASDRPAESNETQPTADIHTHGDDASANEPFTSEDPRTDAADGVPIDGVNGDEDGILDDDDFLPQEPKRVHRFTVALIAVLILGLGVLGGIWVQKSFGAQSAASLPVERVVFRVVPECRAARACLGVRACRAVGATTAARTPTPPEPRPWSAR